MAIFANRQQMVLRKVNQNHYIHFDSFFFLQFLKENCFPHVHHLFEYILLPSLAWHTSLLMRALSSLRISSSTVILRCSSLMSAGGLVVLALSAHIPDIVSVHRSVHSKPSFVTNDEIF